MRKLISSLFLLLAFAVSAAAQERTITGTVTAKEDGLPLPGVGIKVQGTTIGTQSDVNGKFTIKVPAEGKTLVFSFIGFAPQNIPIGSSDVVTVALAADARQLGEVVVTALGISRDRKAVGYAATSVGNAEINRASPTNLVQGLQGKVAGVDISTTSGSPGGSSKVVLRGFSSITGNNQPLYIIDGVPVNNSRPGGAAPIGSTGDLEQSFDFGNAANDINPNDIESVNILKGAAATSLYGSRGSNGVIIVTTKRGQAGKFKVDFSSSSSFTQISIVPQIQSKFGQGWDGQFYLSENGSWGPPVDGVTRPWGAVVNNSQLIRPFSAVKNNYRDAFDTGTEFNNTISISGGNDASTFFLSYGNINSDGVLPGDNDTYKRNNLSLSGSTKVKGFRASASINYVGKKARFVQVGQGDSGIGANFYEEILQIPTTIPIKELRDYKNTYFNVDNYFTPFAENPYYALNENGSRFGSDRVYGNIDLNLKVTDWLAFQFQQGADLTNGITKIWHAKNAPSPGSWNDGANVESAQRQADVGDVREGSEKYFEYDSKFNAIFNKTINSKFDVNGVLGINYNDRGYRTLYTQVEDLTIPGFYSLSNSLNSPVSTATESHRRLLGMYASGTLGYSGYAYLTLNARNDWSSTLPRGADSYFYPSANLAVVLSDAFKIQSSKISLLKVRASWGQTGNDTDPYRVNNILRAANIAVRNSGTTITFPINGVGGYSISNTLNNGSLRPEISTETEFGGEFRFFDNRLGMDLAYYNKVTNDQILPINVAPSTGYNFSIVNFGKVRNRGIELALSGTPIKTTDFNWDIGYTFTRNRNKVLSLPEGANNKIVLQEAYDVQFVAKVGQPLGVFEAPIAQTTPDGKVIVNETNGIPVATSDNFYYGTSQRDFIMGLTNSIRVKDFTLGFTFDWRKGGVFYSGTADLLLFTGNDVKTTFNDRKPFIVPNSVKPVVDDAGNTTYVENDIAISEVNTDDYYYHSSNKATSYKDRILDKSFLKLRDVTLTYNLPKSVSKAIRAGNASVTAFGRNLVTWLPKGNRTIDPEVSNYGNDLGSEFGEFRTGPSTRFFGASLRVSF